MDASHRFGSTPTTDSSVAVTSSFLPSSKPLKCPITAVAARSLKKAENKEAVALAHVEFNAESLAQIAFIEVHWHLMVEKFVGVFSKDSDERMVLHSFWLDCFNMPEVARARIMNETFDTFNVLREERVNILSNLYMILLMTLVRVDRGSSGEYMKLLQKLLEADKARVAGARAS